MKYKIEFDGKSCICTREQIEEGDYDITSSRMAKTQILIYFNDMTFFRAIDMQRHLEPKSSYEFTWMGFDINIECIPEKDEVF
jgi:hypothetical protein